MATAQLAAGVGRHRSFMIFGRILLLLGLLQTSLRQCDARAVNVSNTWTMPQEGLNVFYRFFRDRISWFEADAVCQFHHANLVTVDNSFQFDATRDLLRELDVNDIVWIGLMRPLSSEHFMWSNSRPLIADTGYWAESLPLMESPLCAVIDPIRDYRWHALRCGGPETASFLCEMPVPSWADACILRDMPNLTMQYMADTASIELIRNCEEEGQLRQTCKGKQDRERVIRELICPRERLEAQRINDITNSHFKALQIINSVRTDNNENNEIELLPLEPRYPSPEDRHSSLYSREELMVPTEKNTVQRLIEQFNVDELMQADEPSITYGIPGEIPKPVKKGANKKVLPSGVGSDGGSDYPKKVNKPTSGKQEFPDYRMEETKRPEPKPLDQQHRFSMDDMMMGDQPHGEPEMLDTSVGEQPDDDVSNEIMSPLPHKKKVLPQDLKTMATITESPLATTEAATTDKKETKEEKKKDKEPANEEQKKLFEEKEEEQKMKEAKEEKQKKVEMDKKIVLEATTKKSDDESAEKSKEDSAESHEAAATETTSTVTPTNEHLSTTVQEATSIPLTSANSASSAAPTTAGHATPEHVAPTDSTTVPATIGHPMHPQQPRSNVITEETQHPHIKESADNSHFIPPMLMVKSHYVPPSKQHGGDSGHTHEHHIESGELLPHHHGGEAKTTTATTTESVDTHGKLVDDRSPEGQALEQPPKGDATKQRSQTIETTILKPVMKKNASEVEGLLAVTTEKVTTEGVPLKKATAAEEQPESATTATTTPAAASALPSQGTTMGKIEFTTTTTEAPLTATTTTETRGSTTIEGSSEKPVELPQINEEKRFKDTTTTTATTIITLSTTTAKPEATPETSTEIRKIEIVTTDKPGHEDDKLPTEVSETVSHDNADDNVASAASTTTGIPTTLAPAVISTGHSSVNPSTTTSEPPKSSTTLKTEEDIELRPTQSNVGDDEADDLSVMATTHNFLKDEPEMPFKPNRRRSLTKPESASYFKKILG